MTKTTIKTPWGETNMITIAPPKRFSEKEKQSKEQKLKNVYPIKNPFSGVVTEVTKEVHDLIINLRTLYVEKDLGCSKYFETNNKMHLPSEKDINEYDRLRELIMVKDSIAYYEQVD